MNVQLNNIILSMSTALDLSQMSSEISTIESVSNVNYNASKFLFHSKRTTYIALEICKLLNLDPIIKNKTYISSMIHDIGATTSIIKTHTSEEFIKEHSVSGFNILKDFPKIKDLSYIILYHHENWNGSGALGLKYNDIPIESQLIRISDLIDLQYDESIPAYKQKDHINKWVSNNSSILFNPKLVEAYLKVAEKDIFWLNMENFYMNSVFTSIIPDLNTSLNIYEFYEIAYIFSKIIDNTSKFTARHSRGIADLAYNISKHLGYEEEKCLKMKMAGLLHDIGKLAIPSKILSKNGALTKDEFSKIKSHVYYTRLILNEIKEIPDITDWASNHHEKLNGKGYPQKLHSKDLSKECRLMGVCDIYQALTEDRPYRKGLSTDRSFAILDSMAGENLICPIAVKDLKESLFFI